MNEQEIFKIGDFVSFKVGPVGPVMFGTVLDVFPNGKWKRINPQVPGNIPNNVQFMDVKVVR